MVEQADARDLKSLGAKPRTGSTPVTRTMRGHRELFLVSFFDLHGCFIKLHAAYINTVHYFMLYVRVNIDFTMHNNLVTDTLKIVQNYMLHLNKYCAILYRVVRELLIRYRGVEQLVARRAHNPKVGGSSPPPATRQNPGGKRLPGFLHIITWGYITTI